MKGGKNKVHRAHTLSKWFTSLMTSPRNDSKELDTPHLPEDGFLSHRAWDGMHEYVTYWGSDKRKREGDWGVGQDKGRNEGKRGVQLKPAPTGRYGVWVVSPGLILMTGSCVFTPPADHSVVGRGPGGRGEDVHWTTLVSLDMLSSRGDEPLYPVRRRGAGLAQQPITTTKLKGLETASKILARSTRFPLYPAAVLLHGTKSQ